MSANEKLGSEHRHIQDDRVAQALADRFPDRAVDIWCKAADREIAYTKPSAYTNAGEYLRKARRVLRSAGQEVEELVTYLADAESKLISRGARLMQRFSMASPDDDPSHACEPEGSSCGPRQPRLGGPFVELERAQ